MAIVPTGPYQKNPSESQAYPSRQFFSGVIAVSNSTYDTAHEYIFGFKAADLFLYNKGASAIQIQWYDLALGTVDCGIIEPNANLHFHAANKTGVRVRCDSGSSSFYCMATA